MRLHSFYAILTMKRVKVHLFSIYCSEIPLEFLFLPTIERTRVSYSIDKNFINVMRIL